jgi:ribosomal protein S1/(E)-4-hydroxy-3-methyl-but-2-enyl pyrophosphate reductase
MVEYLEKKGVFPVEDYDNLQKGDTIIIRAHGISPQEQKIMREKGLVIYDATCPYVKKIHNIVKKECNNNKIIIIGDKNHAEVIGIKGYCDNKCTVVNTKEEAENLEIEENQVSIVAQTTITREKWDEIIEIIEKKVEKVLNFDTICSATAKRQTEAKEIARNVDLMIVIGGKNSSNTQKLYELCRKYCKNTYQIEISEDLKNIDFRETKKIGITAGASTPEWIIKEVVSKMEELKKNETMENESIETKEAENTLVESGENNAEQTEEMTMDMEKAYEDSMVTLRSGEIVTGKVIGYNTSEVYVDVGYKADGIINLEEFMDKPDFDPVKELEKDKEMEVFVVRVNDGEGNVLLSKKRVDEIKGIKELSAAYKEKKSLEVKVTEITKGGVVADYKSTSLFIPASQISDKYEKDLEKYRGTTLKVRITEINKRKKRYIASSRVVIEEEKNELLNTFWEAVEVGKQYSGTVKSLTDFGVFVDLGGVDGLIHVSELSWVKVKHPKEIVKVGDVLEVSIKNFDKESGKVSLSYKKEEENPWFIAKTKYAVGDIIKGKVIRIVPFGAFIELEKGIDALVHISQISNKRINDAKDVLEIGQEVEGKIVELDFDVKKISISIKEVNPIDPPETEEEKEQRETIESTPTSHNEDMSVNIGELLKDKDPEN